MASTMYNQQMSFEIDAEPSTPTVPYLDRHPAYSLRQTGSLSVDAMAGPEGASLRTTGDLSDESTPPQSRQPPSHHVSRRSQRSGQSEDGVSPVQSQTRPGPVHVHLSQQSQAQRIPSDIQLIEKLPPKDIENSPTDDDMKHVSRELSNCSISGGESDSSYGSMGTSSMCSSIDSGDWQNELDKYRHEMEPVLKTGFFDVLILYCELDRPAAEAFRDHLKVEIDIGKHGPIKAVLYDEADLEALSMMKIGHLEKSVHRSTYVFIFLTKNFVEDKWMEFSSESCLMEAITNPKKQWCVVPVYTERRGATFKVPMGLNTLKGISYYNNDKFYKNGVGRLIGDKVQVRVNAEKELRREQKRWIEKFKRDEIIRRENEKRIALFEEEKTRQLVDQVSQDTRRYQQEGRIPYSFHHSASTSDISSSGSSSYISHSSSANDLKPQNPAVQDHFNQLRHQNHLNRPYDNGQPQNITIYQRTGSQHSAGEMVSPPVQQMYLIPENMPRLPDSTTYAQQGVKRSNSQASSVHGDGQLSEVGPFQVKSQKYGTQQAYIPQVLWEKLKPLPEEDQHKYICEYFEGAQEQRCEKMYTEYKQAPEPVISQMPQYTSMGGVNNGMYPQPSVAPGGIPGYMPLDRPPFDPRNMPATNEMNPPQPGQGYYYQSNYMNPVGPMQVPQPGPQIPDLSLFHHSTYQSSSVADTSYGYSNSDLSSTMTNQSTQSSYSPGIAIGVAQSMSGNPGQEVPDFDKLQDSIPDADGDVSGFQSGEHNQDKESTRASHREGRQSRDSDDNGEEEKGKPKTEKHVHYHINVYGANAVQVGDHNIAQGGKQITAQSSTESEEEAGEEFEPKEIKSNERKSHERVNAIETVDSQFMKLGKDNELTDRETSAKGSFNGKGQETTMTGEIGTTGASVPSANGSVERDAALSTHQAQEFHNEHPQISPKRSKQQSPELKAKCETMAPSLKGQKKGHKEEGNTVLEAASNMSQSKATVEKEVYQSRGVSSSASKKHSVEPQETVHDTSVFDKSCKEDSVNLIINSSFLKSSEMQKAVVGIRPTAAAKPMAAARPIGVAKPMAAVKPFSGNDDNSNEDNTDLKVSVTSDNTNRKTVVDASARQDECEETLVKQYVEVPVQREPHVQRERLQGRQSAQLLTKMRSDKPEEAAEGSTSTAAEGNTTTAKFGHSQFSDPKHLFYNNKFPPMATSNGEDINSMNTSDASTPKRGTPVNIGEDPLSLDTANPSQIPEGFVPESAPFSPSSASDLEFDMLNSDDETDMEKTVNLSADSQTSSGRSNGRRNQRGVKDKECVIS